MIAATVCSPDTIGSVAFCENDPSTVISSCSGDGVYLKSWKTLNVNWETISDNWNIWAYDISGGGDCG